MTGVTVNPTPLQLTVVIAVITSVGLIVTNTVNVVPDPHGVLGVTIYVAVLAIFVVFVNIPVMLSTGIVCDNPPVIPVPVGANHVYTVPAGTTPFTPSVGVTVNATPLHVVVVIDVIDAPGNTFTTTLNDAPVQLPDVGVTIYVAVTVELVVFINTPLI